MDLVFIRHGQSFRCERHHSLSKGTGLKIMRHRQHQVIEMEKQRNHEKKTETERKNAMVELPHTQFGKS